MAFSRQEYWSGLPFPSAGDLPNPEIEPGSPALQADFLPTELPEKPLFGTSQVLWTIGKTREQRESSCFYRGKGGSWEMLFQTVPWLPFLIGWVRRFLISRPVDAQGEILCSAETHKVSFLLFGIWMRVLSTGIPDSIYFLIFQFFGCVVRHMWSLFPNKGLNPYPLLWKRSVNHWIARESLSLTPLKWYFLYLFSHN